MNDEQECRRATLARNAAGSVQRCTCGTLHLSIGPATLRLPSNALGALRDLLRNAAEAASSGSEAPPARGLPH